MFYPEVTLIIDDGSTCYAVRVPGRDEEEGVRFLEMLGTGGLGGGLGMTHLGFRIHAIRIEYKQSLNRLAEEVDRLRETKPLPELARWASDERSKIAFSMRARQGMLENAVLDVRDWQKYGRGGRTWKNIYARYTKGPDIYKKIIDGAIEPNARISEAGINGMRFLKETGPVFAYVGLGISVSDILMAGPGHYLEAAKREAVLTGAATAGTEVAAGLCVAFGIVTGGWGLIGCGLVGGFLGFGIAGHFVYPYDPQSTLHELRTTGQVARLNAAAFPRH